VRIEQKSLSERVAFFGAQRFFRRIAVETGDRRNRSRQRLDLNRRRRRLEEAPDAEGSTDPRNSPAAASVALFSADPWTCSPGRRSSASAGGVRHGAQQCNSHQRANRAR